MASGTTQDIDLTRPTVSLEEAAAVLGIGRSLTFQLIKNGEFPVRVLRLGRRYRVPTAELRALLGISTDEKQAAG